MCTFLEQIQKVSKDKELVREVDEIDFDELRKIKLEIGQNYVFGTEYKKGAFITDPNLNIIYKRRSPLLFEFLKDWHHM